MNKWVIEPPLGRPIDRSQSHSSGLIGCWLLNEGGGLIAFDSASIGNGIGTGGFAYANNATYGSVGFFSGTTPEINMPLNPIYQPVSMTISGFFYVSSFAANRTILFVPRASGSNTIGYNMRVESSGVLAGYIQTFGFGTFGVFGGTTLSLNTWYHGVFTHDGVAQTGQMFVNGRADSVVTAQNNPDFNNPNPILIGPTIGRYNDGGFTAEPFDGYLKNIMFWNRVLSNDEIWALYLNPYIMFKK